MLCFSFSRGVREVREVGVRCCQAVSNTQPWLKEEVRAVLFKLGEKVHLWVDKTKLWGGWLPWGGQGVDESVVLPCLEVASDLLHGGKGAVKKVKQIPLSDTTTSC